jgi:HPt (histidine-containing phosphotransfer) domain-containing protein
MKMEGWPATGGSRQELGVLGDGVLGKGLPQKTHFHRNKPNRGSAMIPLDEIAGERGLDPEDVVELLQDFLDYTEGEDLAALRAALATGDFLAGRRAAHSIKGAALNLQLSDIGAAARDIEDKCASGTFDGVPELLATLAERLVEVKRFLDLNLAGS